MARRRRWPMVLAALAIALAGGWTWAWNYAASKVEATIERWKAREARVGRLYSCASQSIGGFPFSIQVRCDTAAAELKSMQPPMTLQARNLMVSAEVWQPTVLTSEIAAPLMVGETGKPAAVSVGWLRARTEVHGLPTAPERVTIGVEQPTADDLVQRKRVFQAAQLGLEGRILGGSVRSNPVIEIVFKLTAASAPSSHPAAALPTDADVTAVLHGLKDFSPKSWPARFREIQQANGRIEITKARLKQGESLAVASGVLRVSPASRLNGDLRITIANIEKLLPAFGFGPTPPPQAPGGQVGAALDRVSPGLGNLARRNAAPVGTMGLAFLGQPTDLEGQRAYTLPLRFVEGVMTLGPIKIGETPALF